LSHTPSPFAFSLFLRWGLAITLPRLVFNYDPPTSASWVAEITGVNHYIQLGLSFFIQLMCSQCLSQKSVMGINENNTCGGSWLWMWHRRCLANAYYMIPNPLPPWPQALYDPLHQHLLIPKWAAPEVPCPWVGRHSCICVPKPYPMWRGQKKIGANPGKWQFSSGDRAGPSWKH
jgi:hypothetical protein